MKRVKGEGEWRILMRKPDRLVRWRTGEGDKRASAAAAAVWCSALPPLPTCNLAGLRRCSNGQREGRCGSYQLRYKRMVLLRPHFHHCFIVEVEVIDCRDLWRSHVWHVAAIGIRKIVLPRKNFFKLWVSFYLRVIHKCPVCVEDVVVIRMEMQWTATGRVHCPLSANRLPRSHGSTYEQPVVSLFNHYCPLLDCVLKTQRFFSKCCKIHSLVPNGCR